MFAVVFPGQGSQKPGMGRELFQAYDESNAVFERVSAALGTDVAKLCFESDEDTLRQTQNAQIALFTVAMAAWRALKLKLPSSVRPSAFAGHSVGEYAALAAGRALTVEEAAKLVKLRGELMASVGQSRKGAMSAILGLERDEVERVCREASTGEGVAVVANDNCPGQIVISGDAAAVERAGELAKSKGAKRVLALNVSGAFHSPLMEDASRRIVEALRKAEFTVNPEGPLLYSNVTAEPADLSSAWPLLLETQLKMPVRWAETVRHMLREGIRTFVECGPGEVLCGLIKRIDADARALNVGDPESLDRAVSALSASGVRA